MKKFYSTAIIPILFLCLAMLSSCRESRLETALEFAGENRPELEKVLQHYSIDIGDSLKYRAAQFLIENLPLHYGYAGKGMEDFRAYYDSTFCQKGISWNELVRRAENSNGDFSAVHPEFDLTKLNADFLIRHIDSAFATRQYPWAKEVSFEDFCEYVLPYRIGNEQPEEWMPIYRDYLAETIRMLVDSSANQYTAAATMRDSLMHMKYHVIDGTTMRMELKPSDYMRAVGGACPEITRIVLYALRSVGLPVNYDYIIQWANRNQVHSWNSLKIDTTLYCFGMSDPEFGKHFATRGHERKGKVYRKMFSFQPQSLPNQKGALEETFPAVFRDPFFKDVSELYFDGIDLNMKLTFHIDDKKKFAYLAVFDNRNWVPVAWSKIKSDKVKFEKVEKGCAYMVMYYHEGKLYPATYPFTVSKQGEVVMRKADGEQTAVTLKRKYPIFYNQDFILNRVKKGRFQIANRPDFSDSITVYVTPVVQDIHPYYATITDSTTFRYIRYRSPSGAFVNMAEVAFYDPAGEKLVGEIIGTEGSYWDLGNDKYKLFDGDPLTYFDAPVESRCWGGMAFDTPQRLGSVMFLPRNDDNFIQEGQLYELFYMQDGWFVSLGQRVGDRTHMLKYDDVPVNAMLFLRNLTKGKEERIFTYEDGEQVWW